MEMSLLELFCDVDDFWLRFEPQWKANQLAAGRQRERQGQLCPSEIMTILIHFHQSHYRTFKAYYMQHVQRHLTSEFPRLVSYQRCPSFRTSCNTRVKDHTYSLGRTPLLHSELSCYQVYADTTDQIDTRVGGCTCLFPLLIS